MAQHATPKKLSDMNLKEYLISIGRLKEEVSPEQVPEEPSSYVHKPQTIGEVFDMMKEQFGDKLPPNFLGANAGIWETKIKHPFLKN
jgi:hypothetical protein